MEYTFEHGSYYLRAPSGIVLMTDSVSMAFALRKDDLGDSIVMLKHGTLEMVSKWMNTNADGVEKLYGTQPVAVSFPRKHPVEEINRCLSTSGWVPEFVRGALLTHWVDMAKGHAQTLN